MNSIVINTPQPISVFVTDGDGKAIEGLSISYIIRKVSDNTLVSSGVLTDAGNGLYKDFYTFTELAHFYVIYTTPTDYQDAVEMFEVVSERAKEEDLLRLLGLNKENMRIVDPVYNGFNKLVSATIKIYPSTTDYDADTNVLETYEVSASYIASQLETYGVRRVV